MSVALTSMLVDGGGGEGEGGELELLAGLERAGGLLRCEAGGGDGELERAGTEIGEGEGSIVRGGDGDRRLAVAGEGDTGSGDGGPVRVE